MNQDTQALAKLRFEELLSFFGINAEVQLEEEGDTLHLSVDTADSGRLIGHRGENLRAIQHLLNNMVRNRTGERVFINVDISGYRRSRIESLTQKALEDADKVVSSGQELRLRPMSPSDRRIIHVALAERDDVVTESEGEGNDRRLVIKPKS